MLLARYVLESGAISGVWEGTNQALLSLQVIPDDATHGYLFVEDETLTASEVQEHWQVVDGVLVPKP